jgi:hypothetical protein
METKFGELLFLYFWVPQNKLTAATPAKTFHEAHSRTQQEASKGR